MRLGPGLLLSLLLGVTSLLATLTIAEAQPAGKVYRVGFLGLNNPAAVPHHVEAFRLAVH